MDDMLNLVLSQFKYPCHYDSMGSMILDSNSILMLDVRGWGRIKYMKSKECEELQDVFGEFIANSINKEWENYLYQSTHKSIIPPPPDPPKGHFITEGYLPEKLN